MADRPMNGGSPEYPEFATEKDYPDPVSGEYNVQEPSGEVKLHGWRRLERPPRYWLNWLHRLTDLWIKWFDQEVEALKASVIALASSLSSLASTTLTADTNLGNAISSHAHSGTDSTRVPPNNLQGVSVGDFIMTFAGFDGNNNKPVHCSYKVMMNDWDGSGQAVNPIVKIRTNRLYGLSQATTVYFVTGYKTVLTVSGVLTAGSSTVVTVGGASTAAIPFNTDHLTTMQDIIAAVDALVPVFGCLKGGNYALDIYTISGEVTSASAVTTGGAAVTWTRTAVLNHWPSAIRPNHSSGGVHVPILVWDNGGTLPGALSILNDGTYGIARIADATPNFNGVWTTSANMGFEPIIGEYPLVG